jgi:hypothetical protein
MDLRGKGGQGSQGTVKTRNKQVVCNCYIRASGLVSCTRRPAALTKEASAYYADPAM